MNKVSSHPPLRARGRGWKQRTFTGRGEAGRAPAGGRPTQGAKRRRRKPGQAFAGEGDGARAAAAELRPPRAGPSAPEPPRAGHREPEEAREGGAPGLGNESRLRGYARRHKKPLDLPKFLLFPLLKKTLLSLKIRIP